jgi:hypothetical protein
MDGGKHVMDLRPGNNRIITVTPKGAEISEYVERKKSAKLGDLSNVIADFLRAGEGWGFLNIVTADDRGIALHVIGAGFCIETSGTSDQAGRFAAIAQGNGLLLHQDASDVEGERTVSFHVPADANLIGRTVTDCLTQLWGVLPGDKLAIIESRRDGQG